MARKRTSLYPPRSASTKRKLSASLRSWHARAKAAMAAVEKTQAGA